MPKYFRWWDPKWLALGHKKVSGRYSRNLHLVPEHCTLAICTLVIRQAFISSVNIFFSSPHCSSQFLAVSIFFLRTRAFSSSCVWLHNWWLWTRHPAQTRKKWGSSTRLPSQTEWPSSWPGCGTHSWHHTGLQPASASGHGESPDGMGKETTTFKAEVSVWQRTLVTFLHWHPTCTLLPA